MGYINSATTLTLNAKLTPIGKEKLITKTNNLIKNFSLGDSDSNYLTNLLLNSGEIPSISGDLIVNGNNINTTPNITGIASNLIVNPSGSIRKPITNESINVLSEKINIGHKTISGSSLSFKIIDRNDINSDRNTNLFSSFNLPITQNEINRFDELLFVNGGFANTAFSGFANNKILVIGINSNEYGELIDGKTIKIELPTTGGTLTIFSTYQTGSQLTTLDNMLTDNNNISTNSLSNNISMLVCDEIAKPNNNASLSWSSGYNTNRPFSQNNKKTYNLRTINSLNLSADTLIGLAYLDKGFIVITNPDIISEVDTNLLSGTTLSFSSVYTNVYQTITCIADRGEFGSSTNTTFQSNSIPRISEIGLYDENNVLIAYGKFDRHIEKNINDFFVFSVKLTI